MALVQEERESLAALKHSSLAVGALGDGRSEQLGENDAVDDRIVTEAEALSLLPLAHGSEDGFDPPRRAFDMRGFRTHGRRLYYSLLERFLQRDVRPWRMNTSSKRSLPLPPLRSNPTRKLPVLIGKKLWIGWITPRDTA